MDRDHPRTVVVLLGVGLGHLQRAREPPLPRDLAADVNRDDLPQQQ